MVNCQFLSCRRRGNSPATVLVQYDNFLGRPLCARHAEAVRNNRMSIGVTVKTLEEVANTDPESDIWEA